LTTVKLDLQRYHRAQVKRKRATSSDPFDGRPLGPHLPLAAGLLKAAERAHAIGARAVQVFTDNPTAWRRRTDLPPQLAEFRARLAGYGIGPIAVHAPYLVNLAGADEDFWQRSIDTLVNDMRVAAAYGARFLNVHVGSHRGTGRDAGLARLASGVGRVLEQVPPNGAGADGAGADGDTPPLLVLENSPGSGDGIGSTLEDLADILEAIAGAGVDPQRIGFCLDTAHLWAAGYELDSATAVDGLASRVERLLGRERLVMLHLNDARTKRGSLLDRHEHIGAGQIGPAGLRHLLEHDWLGRLPTYLETPGMDTGYDAVNLERVGMLLAGERLPTLPAEAFSARGSRSRSAPAALAADTAPAA
jgi:deoxyribonuclease-4